MKYIFTLLIFTLIIKPSTAQTIDATLVEINFQGDSNPQNLTAFQSGFFFTATDGTHADFGRELWYSDGTQQGSLMIKDIRLGRNSSNPSSLVVVNNILYFTANDGVHGTELWKSDGTESGTLMIKDIWTNNNNEYNAPSSLLGFNGKLYFNATNGTDGNELWTSDGTESGTVMLKDINPNGNGSPNDLFIFNNNLYFVANDGINGTELWKSDGTESGTIMVKDINSNRSGLNNGNQFLILNSQFYFFANDGSNGSELWTSDGTEMGTTMVKDIWIGSSSSSDVLKGSLLNDIIIFEANDGINGSEIWKSDGTESGTSMIKNINNTSSNSISYNNVYVEFNGEVYFIADDNVHGIEIWRTNGTPNGTILLKDINNGSSSIWIKKIHVDEINNKLLFYTTSTNSSDKTLWVSDGTSNGTFELSNVRDNNISGLEESFVTINNSTIFTGENDVNGNELWITDGTVSGTSFLVDLNYSNSSNASRFTNFNGDLVFRARGKESGSQLFKSDGTISGTQIIKDINPEYNFMDDHTEIKEINDVLYFSAATGSNGYELWRSDGTESGTYMVKDINVGNKSSMRNFNDKQKFTVVNDILYFSADDGIHGFELWRSDGTESGTYMLHDLYVGDYNSDGHPSTSVSYANGFIYYNGLKSGNERGFWKTDGTQAGTTEIGFLSDSGVYSTLNNKLLISLNGDLYATDGTQENTIFLYELVYGISPYFKSTLNNEFYFATGYRSEKLVKTDGTISGTNLLYDASSHPTIVNAQLGYSIACGGYIYFLILDSNNFPEELWRTNGITTEKITSDTSIRNLTCYNNNLLYLGESFAHKIWLTNDNLNETLELNINVLNGPNFEGYNSIEELGVTDNNLYFRARNDFSGNELYITNIDASTLSIINHEIPIRNDSKLVKIYPNPANSFIHIKSISNTNIEKFELWDLSGKIIHKQTNKSHEEIVYDTSKLNGGVYFIKVYLEDGKIDNLKLIVNH